MQILVLPGDHIGPEITDATVAGLEAVNRKFALDLQFERAEVGLASLKSTGSTVPDTVIEAARAADGVILGPATMTHYPPAEQGGINVPATIRKRLDLFANIRPGRTRPGIPRAVPGMDLVMVRENLEGFYSDRNMFAGSGEFMPTEDVALSVRKITAQACRRLARTGFELAGKRRRKVTAVHKATVLKLTDGLFMREVREVARDFPDVSLDDVLVDAMASLLFRQPQRFDVVLVTNMFGDILSNQTAEMSGGLGLAAGLNAGERHAAANAGHGSAPDIAGKDIANPAALMLSSAMLLDWLGTRHQRNALGEAARCLEAAVDAALSEPATRTADLGGRLGTRSFADAVVKQIESD